ncbi:galactokinase [Halosquirtibacter laminarini]|uniref:Galactokinase n=1 Tax=Halosquirtibacter laminarini TaxID=3374600 RepID=A0AC61NP63_9BACT|nr:galactokinase [Prolixibacteraceae bacterium]
MNIQDLKSKFIEKYGEGDVDVFFSPGRVNLIGEHTDYNGGFVFPCALTFGTYCLVRRVERTSFRFASLNLPFETELSMDELTAPLDDKWVNYPLGVLAQFVKKGIAFDGGADLMFYGNVPNGAGLSSSAALEVVTAVAINDAYNTGLDRVELVKMSQKAEHEFAGVHCGIMDQFASGMGAKDHAIFLNCDTLEFDLVPVKLEGAKIVISNTNSPHKLDSGKYNERVAECAAAVKAISKVKPIKNLGELDMTSFNEVAGSIDDEVVRRRAHHVVSEIQRTSDAVAELKRGNIDVFGTLMNASHDSLRDDYEVTGVQLDTMVEEARKIDGVIGSRMTGGGFGGCTVSIVKDDAVDTFISEVGKNYEARTGLKPEFYVAEIGEGGCKLS